MEFKPVYNSSGELTLPLDNVRVLTFSPAYPEGDPMRFRIMDARFVRICIEVTQWSYLVAPT